MRTIEARRRSEHDFRVHHGIYAPGGKPVHWGYVNSRFTTDKLFAYDPILKAAKLKEEEVRSQKRYTSEEVRAQVEKASLEDKADQILTVVLFDVKKASQFRRDDRIESYQTTRRVDIHWNTPYSIKGHPVRGVYLHGDEKCKIKIAAPEPSSADILLALGTDGKLPDPLQTKKHELTHALQYDQENGTGTPIELIEVHAFRTSEETLSTTPPDSIVNNLTTSPVYEGVDTQKANYAVWAIDRMHALDIPDVEIAKKITTPGKWNDKYGVWETLDEIIQDERISQGMELRDLERSVLLRDLWNATGRAEVRNTVHTVLYALNEEKMPLKPAYERAAEL